MFSQRDSYSPGVFSWFTSRFLYPGQSGKKSPTRYLDCYLLLYLHESGTRESLVCSVLFFKVSYYLDFSSLLYVLVVISRLRIGHKRLTHSFILKQEPQPHCLTCQTTCTVKHILIECRTFAVIRKRFFKVNNLTDLFENVKIDDILSFLGETELYQKIWQLETS